MANSPAGTGEWFGWANAVISELIPAAALLVIRRRRRAGQPIGYPMFLLVAAVAPVAGRAARRRQTRPVRLAAVRRARAGVPRPCPSSSSPPRHAEPPSRPRRRGATPGRRRALDAAAGPTTRRPRRIGPGYTVGSCSPDDRRDRAGRPRPSLRPRQHRAATICTRPARPSPFAAPVSTPPHRRAHAEIRVRLALPCPDRPSVARLAARLGRPAPRWSGAAPTSVAA